jgi:type VI secretion system FHA domain protein
MYLTLEVVSPQGASLGSERRQIVGAQGLTIGRVPGNDWVIPDPYVSKHHARIVLRNGNFFVEGLGKNTISMGSPQNAVANHQPRQLKNGDRLFIDQYEILVCMVQGEPPGSSAAIPNDDPFGLEDAASAKFASAPLIPNVWDGASVNPATGAAGLDPLEALGGGTPAREADVAPVNWQQASPLGDHFDPPVPRTAASEGIPNNWDRSGMTHLEGPASRAPERRPQVPAVARPAPRAAAAAQWPAVPQPPVAPRRPVVQSPQQNADFRVDQARGPTPIRPEAVPSGYRAPATRPVPRSGSGNEVAVGGLAELLQAVGLPDKDLSPEIARELGRVLRVVVKGVMDALHARSEIKSQFRLPLTRVQADENNPLKHCPNVESALHTLLVERNAGYLPTVQAFEDAFTDIRNHQMAMLEGLRIAYESMLSAFDPKELEKSFGAKRGGLGSLKARYWNLYVERYAKLEGDADDTFRRLFGDVFAEAYEKQLERLKTLDRHVNKK